MLFRNFDTFSFSGVYLTLTKALLHDFIKHTTITTTTTTTTKTKYMNSLSMERKRIIYFAK